MIWKIKTLGVLKEMIDKTYEKNIKDKMYRKDLLKASEDIMNESNPSRNDNKEHFEDITKLTLSLQEVKGKIKMIKRGLFFMMLIKLVGLNAVLLLGILFSIPFKPWFLVAENVYIVLALFNAYIFYQFLKVFFIKHLR